MSMTGASGGRACSRRCTTTIHDGAQQGWLFLDGADVEGGESGWMALEAGKRKKSSSCDALGDAILAMLE